MRVKGFVVDVKNDGADYYHKEAYDSREEAIKAVCDFIQERGEDCDLSEEETSEFQKRFRKEAMDFAEPEIEVYGEIYSIASV